MSIMTNAEGYLKEPNGDSIELPAPSAYGATFKYWSTSINGTEYDKNAQFTEATTLYAVWDGTPKPYPKKDQSSASAHVHSFKWQTITEPTKDCDGLEGEVCSCGATRKTQPLSAYVYSINEYAVPMINSAKAGQTVTFEFGEWNSFPKSFMEKIAARNDVTFVFHYKWNHKKQEIKIPAGTPVDLNFDWYGPAKMAELYGMN